MNKYKQFTNEQRIVMEVLLKQKVTKEQIAFALGVHRSAIYRELNRNGLKRGGYNAHHAQELAEERKERFICPRKLTKAMEKTLVEKLNVEWSPQQIVGRCRSQHIPMVSHETIYKFIYQNKEQGGALYKKLRIVPKPYRKRYGKLDRRGKIPNRISIEQRPEIINNRERYGDWEADTIIGKNHQGAVLTLVERKSGFTLMSKLQSTRAELTKHALINSMAPFKNSVLSITSDNGHEFFEHQAIANKLNAEFYFTHPYSAWEKGTNENTNGLIRQYLPKATNLLEVKIPTIIQIENKLNNRPRKRLNWKTPYEIFIPNFEKSFCRT